MTEPVAPESWIGTCATGTLRRAQALWATGGVPLHAREDQAWRRACRRPGLQIARWVWKLGGIGPRAIRQAWIRACRDAQLETLQWLWSLDREACQAVQSYWQPEWSGVRLTEAKRLSVVGHWASLTYVLSDPQDGQLAIARWMWGLDSQPMIDVVADLWVAAVSSGRVDRVQWVWETILLTREAVEGVSLSAYRTEQADEGWELAVNHGHLEVARWIVQRTGLPSSECVYRAGGRAVWMDQQDRVQYLVEVGAALARSEWSSPPGHDGR